MIASTFFIETLNRSDESIKCDDPARSSHSFKFTQQLKMESSKLLQILTASLLVGFISGKPQLSVGASPEMLVFAPIDEQLAVFESPIDPSFSLQLSNQFGASNEENVNVQFIPSDTGEVLSEHCPQCLYDFQGNRLNMGITSEQPPTCERGVLVATSIGDSFEMCCCNF